MDEMTSRVKFEGDNGESFEMIVLKEFDYKKRRFAKYKKSSLFYGFSLA